MSKDEQLQLRKETLWELHEKKKLIACLERKLSKGMEAMQKVHGAWESGWLKVSQGCLVVDDGQNPFKPEQPLPNLLPPEEILQITQELQEAKENLAHLKDQFSRME